MKSRLSTRKNHVDIFRELKSAHYLFTRRRDLLGAIILVALAALTLEILAAAVDHLIERLMDGEAVGIDHLILITALFALFILFGAWIWLRRHTFRSLEVGYQICSHESPRPFLVIFVSKQNLLNEHTEIPLEGAMSLLGIELERKDFLKDADRIAATSLASPWPWEMVLRGVSPHLRSLKRIYLVGSTDSQNQAGQMPGTYRHLKLLQRFLLPYLVAAGKSATPSGASALINIWNDPVDFESFEDVHQTLESIHDSLIDELAEDAEICVDITGGQKPTSAAAGLFTMNKDVVIQYVQTIDPKQAQMYEVKWLEWPRKFD